jgi:hypothetical protein
MSRRMTGIVAAAVAAVVLAIGLGYSLTRANDYKSTASLLLTPKGTSGSSADELSSLLDSFQRSGTSGTYVELISSRDTLRRAGVSGVAVTVTPVTDARTIKVETTGPQAVVQPALRDVIRAAQAREAELGDVWQLRVLGSPTPPEPTGITTAALALATVVLALLSALFVWVVLRRYRFIPVQGPAPGADGALDGRPAYGGELEQQAQVRVDFDLESFRYVRASPTTVLLQVTGYWRSSFPRTLEDPTLVLHDDRGPHPLAPLAAPDSQPPEAGPETPLWRRSYASPVDVFDRHERISLQATPGTSIALPDPAEQNLLQPAAADPA